MFNLKDKKIVVTGGTGFLGSFVVEKLKEKGWEKLAGQWLKKENFLFKKGIKN